MLKGYFEVFNMHSRKLVNFLKPETEKDFSDIKKHLASTTLDITCETMLGFSIGAQEDADSPYLKATRIFGDIFMKRIFKFWLWPHFIFRLSGDYREGMRYVKIYYDLARSVSLLFLLICY
ncbi:UNVERIFIED_CONTAM: Cyp4c3 [Trichonephila clavipes]